MEKTEKDYLILDKLLDMMKKIIEIKKLDDKLPDDITLKNAVILLHATKYSVNFIHNYFMDKH